MVKLRLLPLIFLGLSLCACGGTDQELIEKRISATKAFDTAQEAFKAKNFTVAQENYLVCLEGGLYPALQEDCRLKLAVCRAATGNAEQALIELEELETMVSLSPQLLAARSYILQKLGRKREAQVAWTKARKKDKYVVRFED